jgi:hypothetical protein
MNDMYIPNFKMLEPGQKEDSRVRWTSDEWLRVAAKLHEQHPELDLVNAQVLDTRLTSQMVIDAGKAALTEDRHRDQVALTIARSTLGKAFEAIRNNPGMLDHSSFQDANKKLTTVASTIRWDKNERKRLAARLDDLFPGVLLGNGENLTSEMIRQAQMILPSDRRRAVSWLVHERKMFTKVFQEMHPLGLDALKQKIREEVANQAPTPQPELKEVQDVPVQVVDENTSASRRKVVKWTATELVQLAREIHRTNPHAQFPYRETLQGVHAEDIRLAQRVLPADRQKNITTMMDIREQLMPAMQTVRLELDLQKAEEQRLAAERAAAEAAEKKREQEQQKPELQVVKPVTPEPQFVASVKPELMPMMIEAAKPFFDAMWSSFAANVMPKLEQALVDKMMPRIENMILEVMTSPSTPAPAPAPVAAPVAKEEEDEAQPASHLSAIELTAHHDPAETQPPSHYSGPEGIFHRPKVAIIGPRSAVARLEDDYPNIDFTFIEKPTELYPAIGKCDRIIGIQNFVTQAAKSIIKRSDEAKAKYVDINGSKSAVARQIDIWLAAGVLAGERRKEPRYASH